jgi:hypothetical protein
LTARCRFFTQVWPCNCSEQPDIRGTASLPGIGRSVTDLLGFLEV